jgi:HD superfamily phosphodiesterase
MILNIVSAWFVRTEHLAEGAMLEIVIPGAWLHDLVTVPKNSSDRRLASSRSAQAAQKCLQEIGYPASLLPGILARHRGPQFQRQH